MGIFCTVNLNQLKKAGIEVENAKTICQLGQEIFFGSEAKGDSPSHVTLPVRCPQGSKPIGTWHSHPGGVAEPSAQDISEMRRKGFRHMCISSDTETRCYEIRQR